MRWGLTLRGWVIGICSIIGITAIIFLGVHPFLAVTSPVKASILVVEGWIPEDALRQAASEFKERNYSDLYTVGGPLSGAGSEHANDGTYAHLAARRLERAGVPTNIIHIVASAAWTRDRTYSCAINLRDLLLTNKTGIDTLNVLTLSVHARRTRLLYRKAFGDDVEIGVIAIPNSRYAASKWWRFSEGVKEVISESAAYLYARLIFTPDRA